MNNLAINLEVEKDRVVSTTVLITRKTLIQAADGVLLGTAGIYSQEDVFKAVRNVANSVNKNMLLDELAWTIATDRIKAHSKPRLKSQDDWIGYGEMVITLPETKLVNVFYAEASAIHHRKQNVIDNRDKVIRAAEEEIKRIENLLSMMVKLGVTTAGPALKVLSAIAAKKKQWTGKA